MHPYEEDKEESLSPMRGYLNLGLQESEATAQSEDLRKKKAFVWAWGRNKHGELSLGVFKNALLPRTIKGLGGKNGLCISSAANHTALVTQDGALYICGSYLHGKLGLENLRVETVPKFTLIPFFVTHRVT